MLTTILGSLLGFGSSLAPALVDHYKQKEQNKTRLQEMEIKKELMITKGDVDLKMFGARAADDENRRLLEHDIAIGHDTGFAGALRKSVRPIITYAFFALFAAIKILTIQEAMSVPDTSTLEALSLAWDEPTQAIFASVISFWFGSRVFEKKIQFK